MHLSLRPENALELSDDHTAPHWVRVCTSRQYMVCDWCGIATRDGNHGSTEACIQALQLEVTRLQQTLTERKRFADRARAAAGARDARADEPVDRPRWKFKAQ